MPCKALPALSLPVFMPKPSRILLHCSLSLLACLSLPRTAGAQFTPIEVEQAPTLAFLVSQLGAQAAQPSSYLQLDLPDVALPGAVKAHARSALPGTTTLVLARGLYATSSVAPAANLAPPPQLARKRAGQEASPPASPPPVWIASSSYKAGEVPALNASFDVDKTSDFTLFAHAQGRWWFVTRQIKIGTPRHAPAGRASATR